MDLISVIIPVYNTAQYLPRCLDSILAQTHTELEILLVDDGSTDGSGAICDDYAARDGRIRVIHQANAGVSAARNAGLEHAAGAWLGFLDSDDYLDADMYAYLLALAQAHGADLVQCGAYLEEGSAQRTEYVRSEPFIAPNGFSDFSAETWSGLANWANTKLFRAACVRGLRFNADYALGEDLHYVLHALSRVRCVVLGTQAKYHYVQWDGSACVNVQSREKLLSCRRMLERSIRDFSDLPELAEFCRWEQYRTDLDICSKIVCLRPENTADIEKTLRHEIRAALPDLLRSVRFSRQDKLKFLLIAHGWTIYKTFLPRWKARQRQRKGF